MAPRSPVPLDELFERSLDLLAIASDGFLIECNPAWTDVLGWSTEELQASPFLTFVHPDDHDRTLEVMERLAAGTASTNFRNRLRHRDGGHRVLRWSLQPHDGLVYVGARDVTDEIETRDRAELNEAVATGILRTAADPIVVIDASGSIVEVNGATSQLFGYSRDELLGENVKVLMPEPYHSEHDGYLNRYLDHGDPRIIGIGREVEARRADGTVFPISLAVSEVRTATARLFTGVMHDLTERNRQRDELRRANIELEARVAERTLKLEELLDEVQRSNRDLEQFAYIASHDLQAPLRNVRQGLELLDEHLAETVGASFDDEAQELRDLVVAAVLRMEELIKGLLAYSRVQRQPLDDREVVDLTRLVTEIADMLEPEIDAVSGSISVGNLPEISCNTVQLRQVFQNLIENAVRYRSPGRPLSIEIGAREVDESTVTIAVSDNGTGIEAAHHERIFELFRRGHSGYEGVGLGLAICQRIVEGHGGRIWVESSHDAGATFVIRLPRDQPLSGVSDDLR